VFQSFLWSNPIDNTPITVFSELVFDDNNDWTMEISSPFSYEGYYLDSLVLPDSVILKVSNREAKLKMTYINEFSLSVITSDSLSVPLTINRDGDTIEFYTYSSLYGNQVRTDGLIFGNLPGASVGQPVSGYSIMRSTWKVHENSITVICLTKTSSLGTVNNIQEFSGTLEGYIYDMNDQPVTRLLQTYYYFVLHTPITLNSDGTYLTQIFRRFPTEQVGHLTVKEYNFEGWNGSVNIEPFELHDIQPDTVMIQDIHLKNNDYVDTAVENNHSPRNNTLTLINYPNPFNTSTNFFVQLPDGMKRKAGDISIYNMRGELIITIPFKNGASVRWDGKDRNGNVMPSGIFYYQLTIEQQRMKTGSMILLK
jgi:hypothetical protein